MYRLKIGVTPNVLAIITKSCPYIALSDEEKNVNKAVEAHTILYSDKILEYYKSKLGDTYVDSIVDAYFITSQFQKVNPSSQTDGLEELIYFVSQSEMKIMIGEKNEIKNHKSVERINFIPLQQIKNNSHTPLYKFTYPVNYHVEKNCTCQSLVDWFSVLFKKEKKIDIQDSLILNDKGRESIKKFYLPIIEKDTELNIYCEKPNDMGMNDLRAFANNEMFKDRNVHIYICSNMNMKHDRYIEFEKFRISIGTGLDLIKKRGYVIESEECEITVKLIKETERLSIPKVVEQIL